MDKDSDWRLREKVIALIEKHLDHSSKVQHDIKLPVIKSTKREPRQCDIVITQGAAPRQTISIVEVQKRGTKPDINTFNGWVEKKNEVGAQHLLCVSEVGFPDSIQERADELGPTIRLMTINELEQDSWPIPASSFSSEQKHVRYDKLLGLQWEHIHPVRQAPKKPKILPNPFAKFLYFDNGKQISITDLMDYHLFSTNQHLDELPVKEDISLMVQFDWANGEIPSVNTDFQGLVKLKWLKVSFQLSIFIDKIKWTTESYEQYQWGQLAWCLTGKSDSGTHVVIPINRESPGKYSLGRVTTMNDLQAFLSIDSKGLKAIKFDL